MRVCFARWGNGHFQSHHKLIWVSEEVMRGQGEVPELLILTDFPFIKNLSWNLETWHLQVCSSVTTKELDCNPFPWKALPGSAKDHLKAAGGRRVCGKVRWRVALFQSNGNKFGIFFSPSQHSVIKAATEQHPEKE